MMSINSLPEEVLLMIFMKSPWIEDFIRISQVCSYWSYLAKERMAKVKYLIGVYDYYGEPTKIENDVLYYHQSVMAESSLGLLVVHLPNIKVLEVIDPYKMEAEFLGNIIKDNDKIKGLRYDRRIPSSIDRCLENIEMLSTNCMAEAMGPLCSKLKQLYIRYSNERTLAIVSLHSYLERLHINDFVGENILKFPVEPFRNIVILELGFKRLDCIGLRDLDQVIRMCPKLESLYLRLEDVDKCSVDVTDNSTDNILLKNVVLQYSENFWSEEPVLPFIFRFPNLRNLAIRDNIALHDHNVWEIVSELPQLETLDVRGSKNVTDQSPEMVTRLCKFLTRRINYLWGEHAFIRYMHRDLRVSVGFDFLGNIFHRRFEQIPHFIDPGE